MVSQYKRRRVQQEALNPASVDGGPETATDIAAVIDSAKATTTAQVAAALEQMQQAQPQRLVAIRLSLEEAFFLQYVLGALEVLKLVPGEAARTLTVQEMWRECTSIRSGFVESYVGYHHMKAKGWLPRSGLLYGVDYVVYQMHPAVMHSDYGVLLMPFRGPHRPELDWHDIQITSRLIGQVAKKLVLLYIHEREGGYDHSTPACLSSFTVEECLVQRWDPDATRG